MSQNRVEDGPRLIKSDFVPKGLAIMTYGQTDAIEAAVSQDQFWNRLRQIQSRMILYGTDFGYYPSKRQIDDKWISEVG